MRPKRLQDCPSIGVDRVGAEADAKHDPELLRLENLDTDVRPPQAAIDATRIAIAEDSANSYLPFLGDDALRRVAAAHVSRLSGRSYDRCVITAGGLNGILNTLLAMLDPGEEVILTDPIYVGLLNRVRLAGGVPRLIPLISSPEGWRLDVEALRRAITPRTRVVLMMSPSMPTGAVLDREDWAAVARVCDQSGAWLLYDAAMERILYGRHYIHPASLIERTITVGSVSKEYRMIGWRVGWVVGPAEILDDVGLVAISNTVCPVGIGQSAAHAALTSAEDGVTEAVAEWQSRRDLLMQELSGLPVIPAQGGWSLLLDVSKLDLDSATASRRLLETGRIAATPMIHWGGGNSDHYVRFVFSNETCERLRGVGQRVRRALL